MPENHAHSRYIMAPYWYDGHRLDPSDLDLKAYIDERVSANPSSPGVGSGYLVYNARLSNGVGQNPTAITYGSTIEGTWIRHGDGDYRMLTAIPFVLNKIFFPAVWVQINDETPGEETIITGAIPYFLMQSYAEQGFYKLFAVNNGGFLELQLDTFDANAENTDLGALDVPDVIFLPEIRVYP